MKMLDKLATGIPGFDLVSRGGLPRCRTTLVSGTAGAGKTIFAAQFLAAGIQQFDEPGVFVTFEESPDEIRRNMAGFGWDIAKWEKEDKWSFVDASPLAGETRLEAGGFELGALMARVEHAVSRVKACRCAFDSIGSIFARFENTNQVRYELFQVGAMLKKLETTTVITAERVVDDGPIARYGVEEFTADNVIILRNVPENDRRRRTVEILKFRGCDHQKGQFPFSVIAGEGMNVIPLSAIELKQKSTNTRITSGNEELDTMCGGGPFRDSVILVSGATGTGKTLMTTMFLAHGSPKDRCLIFGFEESREQLFRNAHGWGCDFSAMEKSGRLKVICDYPEVMPIEDHLLRIKREVEEYQPTRLAIDSLSALERVGSDKAFREFVIGVVSFIKARQVAAMFTSTTPTLTGGASVTEAHISSITDSIILLRYVELFGEMHRALTVLKMRGSPHDKDLREFTIDGKGMHIGSVLRSVSGILAGNPVHADGTGEINRLNQMLTQP